MGKYRFEEHGIGYQIGRSLKKWRPQFPVILSWVKKNSKVLDVGCGDGVLGEKLIKKGCSVFGVDLDPIGVKEAKRRGVKARVWDVNHTLPFQNNRFDYVICNVVLETVQNPDLVVSEMLRVGNTSIIGFENFGFWFYRLEHLLGKFPKLALYGHNWWEKKHNNFFSLADFFDLPCLKGAKLTKICCIDWKNREISFLAKFAPNLFGRSCILMLGKN